MIELRDATMRYSDRNREVLAVDSATLTLRAGEFLGILGPSGSGKSTLLYLLSGLKRPTSGIACFNERSFADMHSTERDTIRLDRFGFVFQQPYLVGYLSAWENVAIGRSRSPGRESVVRLMEELGIGELADRRPHELSGGERQRVCIARALFGDPVAVFADEPTASLDRARGKQAVRMLAEHRGSGGLAMVTHDPEMLAEADTVVEIVDGRLSPLGSLDRLRSPAYDAL